MCLSKNFKFYLLYHNDLNISYFLLIILKEQQTYVGNQNWEKFLAMDFYISVTQCERKYTAFASKLLQTQTKSIIFLTVTCNRQHFIIDYGWLIGITKYDFNSF